jgi:hypothetical protein
MLTVPCVPRRKRLGYRKQMQLLEKTDAMEGARAREDEVPSPPAPLPPTNVTMLRTLPRRCPGEGRSDAQGCGRVIRQGSSASLSCWSGRTFFWRQSSRIVRPVANASLASAAARS